MIIRLFGNIGLKITKKYRHSPEFKWKWLKDHQVWSIEDKIEIAALKAMPILNTFKAGWVDCATVEDAEDVHLVSDDLDLVALDLSQVEDVAHGSGEELVDCVEADLVGTEEGYWPLRVCLVECDDELHAFR